MCTRLTVQRTKLHHLNGKVFKDEGLPSVKVPAKCLAPSEGTEIPREVYVKLIFHEVVTAGSNYTMSKQTKHIQKLLGILAKLEKAKPREQPSLKVYSKSTQADIGRQIPAITVNSTDVSEIDLGCSMFCTIPNETSVYATPYVGVYKVPVVVEGDQACLQLGRLTVFAEAHGQLISHLLKMFPLKKLSCLQEVRMLCTAGALHCATVCIVMFHVGPCQMHVTRLCLTNLSLHWYHWLPVAQPTSC